MLYKGLVSVSFRPYAPEEILAAMVGARLDAIEWGSDVHAPCHDRERLLHISALQKEMGIRCSSYGTYFRVGKDAPADILPYIEAAKLLGCDILRIWCGTKGSADCTEADFLAICRDSRAIAAYAEAAGVKICFEFHVGTYTDTAKSAIRLMEAVHSPHLRMYWQPSQFRSDEENLRETRMIAPYVEMIHVFNWSGAGKFPLSEAIPLWRDYLSAFDGKRQIGCLLEFMPDGRPETLPRETEALNQILEEHKV